MFIIGKEPKRLRQATAGSPMDCRSRQVSLLMNTARRSRNQTQSTEGLATKDAKTHKNRPPVFVLSCAFCGQCALANSSRRHTNSEPCNTEGLSWRARVGGRGNPAEISDGSPRRFAPRDDNPRGSFLPRRKLARFGLSQRQPATLACVRLRLGRADPASHEAGYAGQRMSGGSWPRGRGS